LKEPVRNLSNLCDDSVMGERANANIPIRTVSPHMAQRLVEAFGKHDGDRAARAITPNGVAGLGTG
jgi:hypothetical protein